MRSSSDYCLSSLIHTPGVHVEDDFIGDELGTVNLLSLADRPWAPDLVERIRGRAVLVALPRQMDAIYAMVLLDGVARRMVLWPHDENISDLGAIMAISGTEMAITTWPPPVNGDNGLGSSIDRLEQSKHPEPGEATQWVLFTSGSTGTPKLVVHTLLSLAGHLMGRHKSGGKRPVWSTFYDVRRYGGLQILLRALLGGGSLVLSSPGETQSAFFTRAAASGVSHSLGTPSHWRRALMTPEHALLKPVYVRLSGEVASQSILDQLRAAYPDAAIVHAFATTEAGLGFEVSDGLAGFPSSFIGTSEAGVALRVAGGTLHIRSARIATQILNRASACVAAEDGFVDTGDEVTLEGGRYFFVGRRDGVINVGGQKVHPEEVEAVINQHPAVQMSLVRARQNPITGAIVVADVVRRADFGAGEGQTETASLEADIKAFCRQSLAPHKIPASIRLVPQISISASGKLVRHHA